MREQIFFKLRNTNFFSVSWYIIVRLNFSTNAVRRVADWNFLLKNKMIWRNFLHPNPVMSREIIARKRPIVGEVASIDFSKRDGQRCKLKDAEETEEWDFSFLCDTHVASITGSSVPSSGPLTCGSQQLCPCFAVRNADTVSAPRWYHEIAKNINLQHTSSSTPVPLAGFWVQVVIYPHFVSGEIGHSVFKMSMQENNAKKLVMEKIHIQN